VQVITQRMGATTVEVGSGHLAMVIHARDVVNLVETAAQTLPVAGATWPRSRLC
jgi:hypothetical protein